MCKMNLHVGNEIRNAGDRNLIVSYTLGGIMSGYRRDSGPERYKFRNY